MTTHTTARWRGDAGTAAGELVVMVPMVMLLVGFAILVGRLSTTQQDVTSASRDAARAAAVRQYQAAARADGIAAAERTMSESGLGCVHLDVTLDLDDFAPGGQVTATVTCAVGLDDVVGLGIPGTRSVTATSTSPVDTYRGG